MDPRGFPTSPREFQRVFPDDGACCAHYLESLRWPTGFTCRQGNRLCSFNGSWRSNATRRRLSCSISCVPAWCVLSVTPSAASILLKSTNAFWGGRTRAEGRGVHHKATVVGAVEVRKRQDAQARAGKHRQEHDSGVPLKKLVYAGRLLLCVVDGRTTENLESFVKENVVRGSLVRTDGWQGATKGYPRLATLTNPSCSAADNAP